jgi:hypothetical protein
VPVDDEFERAPECPKVQRAAHVHGRRAVVGRITGFELVQKPEGLLTEAHRQRLVTRDVSERGVGEAWHGRRRRPTTGGGHGRTGRVDYRGEFGERRRLEQSTER